MRRFTTKLTIFLQGWEFSIRRGKSFSNFFFFGGGRYIWISNPVRYYASLLRNQLYHSHAVRNIHFKKIVFCQPL